MEFIKQLKDYVRTPQDVGLNDYLTEKLASVVCHEKIKNKEYMLEYLKPVHDFVIFTTALPGANIKRAGV